MHLSIKTESEEVLFIEARWKLNGHLLTTMKTGLFNSIKHTPSGGHSKALKTVDQNQCGF
jgi:hypothetical protein